MLFFETLSVKVSPNRTVHIGLKCSFAGGRTGDCFKTPERVVTGGKRRLLDELELMKNTVDEQESPPPGAVPSSV